MTRVLFVCVKNGGKSQMAAGLLRQVVAADPDTKTGRSSPPEPGRARG